MLRQFKDVYKRQADGSVFSTTPVYILPSRVKTMQFSPSAVDVYKRQVATHLHKQPSGKWSSSERCTGTVRTLRCQYHNECLRPFNKKSQAGIRKVT